MNLLLRRSNQLLDRMELSFKWTQKDLNLLKEALLGLSMGFDEIERRLQQSKGPVKQKQCLIFFQNEYRLWDSRQNWDLFQKRWKLIEGVHFQFMPKGALVADKLLDPSKKCGIDLRCVPSKCLPKIPKLGELSIKVDVKGDMVESSTYKVPVPFIPSVDVVYSKHWSILERRETLGRTIARSGITNPSEIQQTFETALIDAPTTTIAFPRSGDFDTFHAYALPYKKFSPTMLLPLDQLSSDFPTNLIQSGIKFGGGKELPVPPHLDVVCVQFLQFLQLT